MTIGTLQVGATTAPTVVSAFFSHYLHKSRRKKKARDDGVEDPAVDLVYDEGIKVLRAFLDFSAKHTLEETQAFTALYVPCPVYVRKHTIQIPYEGCIDRAEELLVKQLESYGPESIKRIGGRRWWRVRGRDLQGEWIEMKRDYVKRKADYGSATSEDRQKNERVILYIHGGAYFFSSLDTHRYQVQRHARKLGGRAFSPAYRLAPQYPFPCAILDCLAAYLYLIDPPTDAGHSPIHPSSIILAGDSAGAGAVLALLVTIRDQGLPMPAGANLFSPWVDLCHSFPSVIDNRATDYIPGDGFHYRSSMAWPPVKEEPFIIKPDKPGDPEIRIDEQIQLYTSNALLTHPLVSPVNHGSLGGLCPLLVHAGGGELLRDEQIYLAHKAAAPERYPPPPTVLEDYPNQADLVKKFKPTKVQIQIFDGCAHVIPTLAITTPAKYMYRSAANFNIWAIIAAKRKLQHQASKGSLLQANSAVPSRASTLAEQVTFLDTNVRTATPTSFTASPVEGPDQTDALYNKYNGSLRGDPDNDRQSEISDSSCDDETDDEFPGKVARPRTHGPKPKASGSLSERIIVSGTLPAFGHGHIIRQRASCHGRLRPMEAEEEMQALTMSVKDIGRVRLEGPVGYWLQTRQRYHRKYAKDLKKFRQLKSDDYAQAKAHGFLTRDLADENPPQCALVSWYNLEHAQAVGKSVDEVSGKSNAAVSLYMRISQKADREQAGDTTDASRNAIEKVKSRQH